MVVIGHVMAQHGSHGIGSGFFHQMREAHAGTIAGCWIVPHALTPPEVDRTWSPPKQ